VPTAVAVALVLAFFWGVALRGEQRAPDVVADPARRQRLLAIEDARNPTAADLTFLIGLARENAGPDKAAATLRIQAIRALGRLERRDLIPVLSGMLEDRAIRAPASLALLVTLRAHDIPDDPEIEAATDALLHLTDSPVVLRHLPYKRAAQVRLAESKLLTLAKDPLQHGAVAASFEVLARRHRKLHTFEDSTLEFLGRAVRRELPRPVPNDDLTPRLALAALAAAGHADEDIVRAGLRDRDGQVRRIAMAALNSAGAAVDPGLRTELTRTALDDSSPSVRYEAVRGWARRETTAHGCGPLLDALGDRSVHVVLAAIDALGERCPADDDITSRLVYEARTPPTIGSWHREAHAFLALARRAPERAAMSMPAFISHDVWQVRMYAARAAAAMKDVASLERLAYDAHDNVREATLAPLRAQKQSDSDAAFIDALGRSDYQLLRTAAIVLKEAAPDKHLLLALTGAFERISREKKDTARDTRLALLERIRAMGGREQLPLYERHLKDFDPKVAAAAAEACSTFSAQPCAANPQPQPRPPVPTAVELSERVKAVVHLDNGRRFDVSFNRELAPLAYARFVRLARAHYYDGLTFHRVEPNFVIQGGSPGANEYVGDGPFMRDEVGGTHRRGTVGISTRGRDTGDAQIFVNLVDNPRLDYEYTAFASVSEPQMDIIDSILEGTRILRIEFVPGP
jgi:cyclophilin family peptidyl-prolyl cis-trans isomerase